MFDPEAFDSLSGRIDLRAIRPDGQALGTQTFDLTDFWDAAAIGNIGPGLAGVGPVANYAWMPAAGKVVLSLLMLMGRLEIYTVLVLFHPEFWRR